VAIIRLMFDLGLRRGEVVGLDGRGRGPRRPPPVGVGKGEAQKEARTLPAPTMEAIDHWLKVRDLIAKADELALFVNTAQLPRPLSRSEKPRRCGRPESTSARS